MARPKKTVDERRRRGSGIRFTDEEFAVVAAKADALGTTVSAYVRDAALNRPLPRVVEPAAGSLALSFSLANELRRVGVNLNQIARLSHMGVERSEELTPLLEDIRLVLSRIHGPG